MNILYLGPYRQNDELGICSKKYLEALSSSSHKVTSRCIYINPTDIDSSAKTQNESNIYSSYDIIIQHLPISHCSVNTKVKNILIPIVSDTPISDIEADKLNKFDTILVDSKINELKIRTSLSDYLTNKVILFKHDINYEELQSLKDAKYNTGVYAPLKKLYFIGDYRENKDLVHNILESFYLSYIDRDDICLVLFLNNFDEKNIQEYIQNILASLKIQINLLKTLIIQAPKNNQDLIVAHRSCDIFLNLNKSVLSNLNEQYCEFCQNKSISLFDVETFDTYINNNTYNSEKFYYVLQNSLIEQMKSKLSNELDQKIKSKPSNSSWNTTPTPSFKTLLEQYV